MSARQLWSLSALLALGQFLFVAAYVSHEHTFYFWDHAMYHALARESAVQWHQGFGAWIGFIKQSLGNNYNGLFTVPSLATFYLWGNSRLVFILTNFTFYFIAYEISIAYVLRRIFTIEWPLAVLLTLIACSCLSYLWLPLLQGFPDNIAAALIIFAVGTGMKPHKNWRSMVGMGLLLGSAVLLRRHFAYSTIAVLATAGMFDLLWAMFSKNATSTGGIPSPLAGRAREGGARLGANFGSVISASWLRSNFHRSSLWNSPHPSPPRKGAGTPPVLVGGADSPFIKRVLSLIAHYLLASVVMIGVLYGIAPDFVANVLATNYSAMYQTYQRSIGEFLYFVAGGFGYLPILAAAMGLIVSGFVFPSARRGLAFVVLYTFLWLVVWCLFSKQASPHFMMEALAFCMAIGLGGLMLVIAKTAQTKTFSIKTVLAFVLFLALAGNVAWSLWFSHKGIVPCCNGVPSLLSAARPPFVRHDYDELVALTQYLADTTTPSDHIVFGGASFLFNQDLMQHVFAEGAQRPDVIARFVWASEIDHEQPAPVDAFASATVYVVADPPQYDQPIDGQKVVTSLVKQFPPPPERAGLFKEDAKTFALEGGMTAHIWRRSGWTPVLLHQALQSMRALAKDGMAHDWVAIKQPLGANINEGADGHATVMAVFDNAHPDLVLFFDVPLKKGHYRFGTDITSQTSCPDLAFTMTALVASGNELWHADFKPVLVSGSVYHPFTLEPNNEDMFLRLTVHTPVGENAQCMVTLQHMGIEVMR